MTQILREALATSEHLSSSTYDIAACALYDGPSRTACLQWLIQHQNPDGSWGETLSWQDRYLSTYSAAIAMLAAGQQAVARHALSSLPTIPDPRRDNWTMNFGGLIAAIDAYAAKCLHFSAEHPPAVREAIGYDWSKWEKIVRHKEFYNPITSIVGHFAEWSYILPQIDLKRLLERFQVSNGSISNSPGSSAFCLMACDQARLTSPQVDRLRRYVESIDPCQHEIGMLDQAPHFVTVWLLLYLDHSAGMPIPETRGVSALRRVLAQDGKLVSVAGDSTFPGDIDTTASAIIALNLPRSERERIMKSFDDMFDGDHYGTLRYERTPAVTTNVHAVAAWPDNPRIDAILEWLNTEIAQADGLPLCKWHTSPFYTLGEIGRLFPDVKHPAAIDIARRAGRTLLDNQLPSGAWGWAEATSEETCYAILALDKLRKHRLLDAKTVDVSLQRAIDFLRQHKADARNLWIGKSLYHVKPLEAWLRHLALSVVTEKTADLARPISVLYVDDNPSWRQIFRTYMDYHDLQLEMAEDAESALAYLRRNTPDVVVMDIVLPGMDGYQAFRKIREMSLPCSVVATTAYCSADTSKQIKDWGFNGYLEKPFDALRVADYLTGIVRDAQ
jgi:halimadienyl-diphosphate synthase